MNRQLTSAITVLMFASGQALGAQLWNNGPTDTSHYIHVDHVADDFHVPTGGWWIDSARLIGNWGLTLSQPQVVALRIMSADPFTGLPDHSCDIFLNLTGFSQNLTGVMYGSTPEVEILADFPNTYLPWGAYWLEMYVEGTGAQHFRHMARAGITGMSALDGNDNPINRDVCFQLFGTAITTVYLPADDFVIPWDPPTADPGRELQTSDDLYYSVNGSNSWRRGWLSMIPALSPVHQRQFEVNFSAGGSRLTFDDLALVMELSSLGDVPTPFACEVWLPKLRRWQQIATGIATRSDIPMALSFATPSRYLDRSGNIRLRMTMDRFATPGPWGLRFDQLYWVALVDPRQP